MTARGGFDVTVTSKPADDPPVGPFQRLVGDKQFHGDLEGTGLGQMLAWGTPDQGSAAYVALELVTGTLNGKKGSFVLQHHGTMSRGVPTMHVAVLPESGTGGLAGIAGTMKIVIEGGKHSYELEYTLPRP